MFNDIPPIVGRLLLINVVAFLLTSLVGMENYGQIIGLFGLVTSQVLHGMVWQIVTYMFLHGSLSHLFFNMFGLWMFGRHLELYWGSRDFLKYYLITGAGAGVIHMITTLFTGGTNIPTIGASGALFGILLAYGMAFPHHQVLLWFVLPISARTMVILYGALELFMAFGNPHSGIARFAHLGGMLVGYLYLKRDTFLWRFRKEVSRRRTRPQPREEIDPEEDRRRREQIDSILDKISREGMGSLSPEERRILNESAERARRRQRGD